MAIDWLEELEGKVREATRRLGELQEKNRGLARRVEELEGAAEGADEAAWEREREEIRRRVEKLTATLEELEASEDS